LRRKKKKTIVYKPEELAAVKLVLDYVIKQAGRLSGEGNTSIVEATNSKFALTYGKCASSVNPSSWKATVFCSSLLYNLGYLNATKIILGDLGCSITNELERELKQADTKRIQKKNSKRRNGKEIANRQRKRKAEDTKIEKEYAANKKFENYGFKKKKKDISLENLPNLTLQNIDTIMPATLKHYCDLHNLKTKENNKTLPETELRSRLKYMLQNNGEVGDDYWKKGTRKKKSFL